MKTVSITLIFDFPVSLAKCTIFDIGHGKHYIDFEKSRLLFQSAYDDHIKNEIESLVNDCQKEGVILSVYFSGFFLELLQKTDSAQLANLKKQVAKGNIEILGGTINHSLASLYAPVCFEWEIIAHLALMKKLFDVSPDKFYNTENLFFDGLVAEILKLGFTTTFSGVVKWYLGENTDHRIFKSPLDEQLTILLVDSENQNILFEANNQTHQILQFDLPLLEKLGGLSSVLRNTQRHASIVALDQLTAVKNKPSYKVKSPTIGSIHGRSIASYNGEAMQINALRQYYALSKIIDQCQYLDFMKDHADLGMSDIFLQFSKFSTFSNDPFETYSQYMNMITGLNIRLGRKSCMD